MTVDLSVLDSLGINLYSNAAAVLSELVANAYDADATKVDITWEQGERVTVGDDGCGMTVGGNERTLPEGRLPKARGKQRGKPVSAIRAGPSWAARASANSRCSRSPTSSPCTRRRTARPTGFRSTPTSSDEDREAVRTTTRGARRDPGRVRRQGTTLVLTSTIEARGPTAKALRKRLARRSTSSTRRRPQGRLRHRHQRRRRHLEDRQELKSLQFIWEFGDDRLPDDVLPGRRAVRLPGVIDGPRAGRSAAGSAPRRSPRDLTEGHRGRLAEEHHRARPEAADPRRASSRSSTSAGSSATT